MGRRRCKLTGIGSYLLALFNREEGPPLPSTYQAEVGTASIYDSAGKLYTSGGELRYGGATVDLHDPRFVFSQAIDRQGPFNLFVWKTYLSMEYGNIYRVITGVFWNASGSTGEHRILPYGAATLAYNYQEAGQYINNNAPTTVSSVLLALRRSRGGFLFDNSAGGKWLLRFVFSLGSRQLLYPGLISSGVNGYPAHYAFMRVPTLRWCPVPEIADSFSNYPVTDGNYLDAAQDERGGAGRTWCAGTGGTWSVSAGKLSNNPNPGNDVVTNGTFDVDQYWTKGAGWSIANGQAEAVNSSAAISQDCLTVDTWYRLSFDVTVTSGSLTPSFGSGWTQPAVTASGSYVHTGLCLGNTTLSFTGSNFSGKLDNVVCQPLTLTELINGFATASPDNSCITETPSWRTGCWAGIVVSLDSFTNPQNFLLWIYDGNSVRRAVKMVNGVYTLIATRTTSWNANFWIGVHKDRSATFNYKTYSYSSSFIEQRTTATDSSLVDNTKWGLFSTNPDIKFSSFALFPSGMEDQYQFMNALTALE